MAELDTHYYDQPEDAPSESDISDRWLYLLGCIFFGSPGFGSEAYEFEFNHSLRLRFQEVEASTLLISIAAAVRRRSAKHSDFEVGEIAQRAPSSVGYLIKNHTEPKVRSDLSIREACNKIIHADKINYDYQDKAYRRGGILNPIVHCYGTLGGSHWKATIDVREFIKAAWHQG